MVISLADALNYNSYEPSKLMARDESVSLETMEKIENKVYFRASHDTEYF